VHYFVSVRLLLIVPVYSSVFLYSTSAGPGGAGKPPTSRTHRDSPIRSAIGISARLTPFGREFHHHLSVYFVPESWVLLNLLQWLPLVELVKKSDGRSSFFA